MVWDGMELDEWGRWVRMGWNGVGHGWVGWGGEDKPVTRAMTLIVISGGNQWRSVVAISGNQWQSICLAAMLEEPVCSVQAVSRQRTCSVHVVCM